MDAVKQWFICIIFCSVVTAIVSILTPDGSVQRAVKTVVSTFMLCAFLSPLLIGEEVDLSDSLPDFSDYQSLLSENISDVISEETEKAVKVKINELLNDLGVKCFDQEISLKTDENNEIFVDSITLSLDEKDKYREKQITSNLKSMFFAEVHYLWKKN